jgi:hypothetical protein
MRTPPTTAPNKFTLAGRVTEVEVVAGNALTAARQALEQLKLQPPRGEKGETGPQGLSITGPAGRDGVDGRPGRDAVGVNGSNGRDGKDGAVGATGPDSAAVLVDARREIAELKAAVAAQQLIVNAIYDQNRQAKDYIEFLKQKVEKRKSEASIASRN